MLILDLTMTRRGAVGGMLKRGARRKVYDTSVQTFAKIRRGEG